MTRRKKRASRQKEPLYILNDAKKILKSQCMAKERISAKAIRLFAEILTNRTKQVIRYASDLAKEQDRDEIIPEDIKRAFEDLQSESPFVVSDSAPMVHYVWFLGENGTCLLSRSYSGLEFPDTLFAGLMTGIINICLEVTGRQIQRIQTEDLVIHVRKGNNITVVVISDSDVDEPIEALVGLLTAKFEEKFGLLLEDSVVDLSVFEDFEETLDKLVTASGLKLPTEMIESYRLSKEEIVETVSAAGLKEELKRAQQRIKELPIFQKSSEERITKALLTRDHKDIDEIMNIVRSAQQAIKKEIVNNNDEVSIAELLINNKDETEISEKKTDVVEKNKASKIKITTDKKIKKDSKKTKKTVKRKTSKKRRKTSKR